MSIALFILVNVAVLAAGCVLGRFLSLSSKQYEDATLPKDQRGIGGLEKESEASIG